LFGLPFSKGEDALFAALHKFVDAVGFYIALVFQAEFFFDFHFDPQTLAVKAVLVALLVALHGFVALVKIFVGAPPGVMDSHRVIGRDGAIQKRVLLIAVIIAMQVSHQNALFIPPLLGGAL